jgi:D-alanyl-D-alanine carboxypeptidase (penicillin-binding protein 5/6)
MQRGKLVIILVILVLFASVSSTNAFGKEPLNPTCLHVSYPEPRGMAAVLMDADSGRVLYSKNSHEQLPPASLTKIMTALLVVENGNLDKEVYASEHASKIPESSINLRPGEMLTRRQLLYACMLHSANDAATALAESVAGSEVDFVKLMNKRADQLGMRDTHFCNAHGLETKGHYTSAYDLTLLTRQAMTNFAFRQVVKTKEISIPREHPFQNRVLFNENRLLNRYQGTIGVKTGYTRQAGNCVVGVAQRGNLELIAVCLNSPDVYNDLEKMLDFGFSHYQKLTLKKAEQVSVKVNVLMGQSATVTARPGCDLAVAITPEEKPQLTYRLFPRSQVFAPVKPGDIVGTCKIFLNGCEISQVKLVAGNSVPLKKSLGKIYTKASKLKWYILPGGMLLVLLLSLLF